MVVCVYVWGLGSKYSIARFLGIICYSGIGLGEVSESCFLDRWGGGCEII